ncbi:hypothetical protein [Paenibacillus harenae]|uniref:hypothetical protein n=1 Tax=Paenibacillus harenae TaxID=306543 RepID=UPI00048CFD39|nr:hypothetical protein [Paenibacillus harenae]
MIKAQCGRCKVISDYPEGIRGDLCPICGSAWLVDVGVVDTPSKFAAVERGEMIIPLGKVALLFVQEMGSRFPRIYQDGRELKGVRSITIHADADDVTRHTVEFVTGHTADALTYAKGNE